MAKSKGVGAFTLIELLAVIAIIGLLAALGLGVGGVAVNKQRAARVKGEHANLVTAIESYKAELGTYPPDNANFPAGSTNIYDKAKMHSLFYELSGAVFTNNTFVTLSTREVVTPAILKTQFGVDGVQNSARRAGEVPFRGVHFRPSQFADVETGAAGVNDLDILVVPIKGPAHVEVNGKNNKKLNPWLYDASSTNRHNLETFDLWAEYLGKNQTITVGNWKE